jgi:heme-degrading monooxygenase HmoA
MFARTVRMHLKPNSLAQFTETMERDVIPLLRTQQGFKDEITFLPADGSNEAVAISFWEKRENADAYQHAAYADVLKAVAKVADGAPQVQMAEVSNSTWHKIAAR